MSPRTLVIVKGRAIVGTLALAVGYLAGSTAAQHRLPSIPADAAGIPEFGAARPTAPEAGVISSRASRVPKATAEAGIGAQTACEGAAGSTNAGHTSSPGLTRAGATAPRFGEPAPSGRAAKGSVRRHRAPVFLFRIVKAAAEKRRVPVHILAGLAEDESSWRPAVRGRAGEVGLLQLSRAIAEWCGVSDRRNAHQNADCGARLLAAHFARFGTWDLALVAFKAGPDGIPEKIPARAWAFAQRTLVRAEAYR